MTTIEIPLILLRHPSIYLFDGEQYDILGCILFHKGYTIRPKMKSPADLKLLIPNFTLNYRKAFFDSPLTLSMLQLDFLPQKEAVARANKLLEPIMLQIKTVGHR
jgi:hypothetical protein